MVQNAPKIDPRRARNLPEEKTESGVRNSSWCNGAPPCLLRLSGGPTVNLSRFPCSGGPTVNLSCCLGFRWSYGKPLAFSVVWWSYEKSLAFSVVWWSRGKSLAFSLVRWFIGSGGPSVSLSRFPWL